MILYLFRNQAKYRNTCSILYSVRLVYVTVHVLNYLLIFKTLKPEQCMIYGLIAQWDNFQYSGSFITNVVRMSMTYCIWNVYKVQDVFYVHAVN